jgi:hypothetical protein
MSALMNPLRQTYGYSRSPASRDAQLRTRGCVDSYAMSGVLNLCYRVSPELFHPASGAPLSRTGTGQERGWRRWRGALLRNLQPAISPM